jgi:hypothetical protein
MGSERPEEYAGHLRDQALEGRDGPKTAIVRRSPDTPEPSM